MQTETKQINPQTEANKKWQEKIEKKQNICVIVPLQEVLLKSSNIRGYKRIATTHTNKNRTSYLYIRTNRIKYKQ